MIHLEILIGPDKNALGSFQYFQNEIYLGKTSGDLHVQDSQLKDIHLMIEVVEKDLIVHPQKSVEFYLIDGKRSSSIRKVKAGQKLTIGGTTIKIVGFEFTEMPSKKAILDTKLAQLAEQNSPRLVVIEKLAKMMK